MEKKLKVYIVGTHGVPARYGGFESLADHLCQQLGNTYELTVFCNKKKYPEAKPTYFGAALRYLNIDASGFSGIFYDLFSYPRALRKADVVLFFGVTGSGFIVPLHKLYRTKVIVNHGGLNEWEREKLSWLQKKWARFNHRIAARSATLNIADNELYRESLRQNFGVDSVVIKYGGDHVYLKEDEAFKSKYPFADDRYAISVSRAQVDNNLHLLLNCFTRFKDYPLVLISNWEVSDYGKKLRDEYSDRENLILLDAIYDTDELNYLRGKAYVYIHSHSRCGTAPSLVEAMSLGKAVISFDAPVNRETTEGQCPYFKNEQELEEILKNLKEEAVSSNAEKMGQIADNKYSWSVIAKQYQDVIDAVG